MQTEQQETRGDFSKVIHPADVPTGDASPALMPLYCKIEFKSGRLSISGVEGPLHNGDARGSCGQVSMHYKHRNPAHDDKRTTNPTTPDEMQFSEGWDAEKWLNFLDVWAEYHLNDMRPNCEHQTGEKWDTSRELTFYHWTLTREAMNAKDSAEKAALRYAREGKPVALTPVEVAALNREYSITTHDPELSADIAPYYQPKTPIYNGDKSHTETKLAGWVYPKDHPQGLLTKPCEVCGYKYGSQWRRVEVPQDVLDLLQSLPDTDTRPAWV